MGTEPIPDEVFARLIDAATAVAAEHAARVDAEGRYPHEAVAALRRLGLLNLLVPRDLGGLGETLPRFVEVVRRLAQGCGSTALCYAMHVGALHTLVGQAHDARRAALVRASCATGELCTIAVSPARSPDGGRAPLDVRRVAGGYRLDGRKAWCTGAVASTALLVYAPAEAEADGLLPALLWIRLHDTPGVRVEETWQGTGMRGSRSDTVVFEGAVVPRTALVGEEGRGDALLAAAQALAGRLQTAATPPPVALALASADVAVCAAAAAIEGAARTAAAGLPAARPAILAAKAAGNLAAVDAADAAMAAVGASGYQRGAALERHWRDAHAGRLMVPTPDDCRVALARIMLGWS